MFQRKRSFVRRGGKKNFLWVAAATTGINLAASTKQATSLLVVTDGGSDSTLYRIRGRFYVSPQNPFDTSTVIGGAVGIIKVSDIAAGVGITAVEGPLTNAGSDWIWHSYFFASYFQAAVDTAVVNPGFMVEIDSKARRRIDDNEQLVLVVETNASAAVTYYYGTRVLVSPARR